MSWGRCPADTQYSGNIRWVIPQCCDVRDIQWTLREHLEGKDFLKSSRWKSCFCWIVYDLPIANVDLLASSSNHEAIFEEHSTNVCFKNIPRISLEYCKVMKIFFISQNVCETFNICSLLSCNVFLNFMETVLRFASFLGSWKKFQNSITLL